MTDSLQTTSMTAFEAAKEQRQKADLIWKFGLLATILCMIEIPMPPITPFLAFIGTAIFGGLTANYLIKARRLPVREALLLAQARGGELTLTSLCVELELSAPVAKVLLAKMQQQGLLQVDDDALLDDGNLRYLLKS